METMNLLMYVSICFCAFIIWFIWMLTSIIVNHYKNNKHIIYTSSAILSLMFVIGLIWGMSNIIDYKKAYNIDTQYSDDVETTAVTYDPNDMTEATMPIIDEYDLYDND